MRPPEAKALAALQAIVAPDGCRAKAGFCLSGETTFASGKKGVKFAGPMGIGPSLAEDLLLEYAQGLPRAQVGWGAAGHAAAIAGVMPVHERSANLLRQTPYLAIRNGAVMALTVLDLLQGQAPSSRYAPPLSPTAKLVVLAGHDTNLSNMAGTFDLDWVLPNQPDVTAPDTVLAFELWRERGVQTVRAVVYSQSLEQLRSASRLDRSHPAGVTPIAIPGCAYAQGVCRLETLVKLLAQHLPADCLH
jgi:4-phytase/acid phosphatase